MLTRDEAVHEFIRARCTFLYDGGWEAADFNAECQEWAAEHGYNVPRPRTIARILKENNVLPCTYGIDVYYDGIIKKRKSS